MQANPAFEPLGTAALAYRTGERREAGGGSAQVPPAAAEEEALRP